MKRIFFSLLALLSSLVFAPAVHAQADQAQTVSACGTPNNTPVVGQTYPITQDTTAKICISGAGGVAPAPLGVTSTDHSGNVTSGGNFTIVLAASATRKGCLIQNPIAATETLFVNDTGNATATTGNSTGLAPGAVFNCTIGGTVDQGSISVSAATTSHAFVATSQ